MLDTGKLGVVGRCGMLIGVDDMMVKWEERFRSSLVGLDKKQLTEIVNYCFSMCNSLSGYNYTTNKREQREIWKAKAKIAIGVRNALEETK